MNIIQLVKEATVGEYVKHGINTAREKTPELYNKVKNFDIDNHINQTKAELSSIKDEIKNKIIEYPKSSALIAAYGAYRFIKNRRKKYRNM